MRDTDLLKFGDKRPSGGYHQGRMSFFFHGPGQIDHPSLGPAELKRRQNLHHLHSRALAFW